jgi:carbon monoxide dehydrogenase subunit G
MSRIIVTRTIKAPLESVFKTVADVQRLSAALPHIVKIEFLSEVKSGVGARFRETRLMNGKEAKTELEVTEFVAKDRVRLVAADSQGTVWDTVFAVKAANERTVLTMTMDAKTQKWLSKVFVFMISGMIKRAVERDMDLVKAFCERMAGDHPGGG